MTTARSARVRQLVFGIADARSTPLRRVRTVAAFDGDAAWRWIKPRFESGRPQREAMKFAAWLWRTGTRDMDHLIALLDEARRKNPACWYAYFAPGGTARVCRRDQKSIADGEAEGEAHKRAEQDFLGGKG